MGAYQCKKCDVPITHHKMTSDSCRVHNYIDTSKKILTSRICNDCDITYGSYANCRHKFKFKLSCC
jgi:hypothetical protein